MEIENLFDFVEDASDSNDMEFNDKFLMQEKKKKEAAEDKENQLDSPADNLFFKWNESLTKYMLHQYAELFGSVGPKKVFRTKKSMWEYIASLIWSKFGVKLTAIQVESRYKCVMRRTKKNIDNNNRSGAVRQVSLYDDDIEEIVMQDDSVVIDTGLSPGNIFQKKDFLKSKSSVELTVEELDSPKKKKKTQQTLLFEKFLAQKEEHFKRIEEIKLEKLNAEAIKANEKKQRHEEKMKILNAICANILKKDFPRFRIMKDSGLYIWT